jgi:hypothetical protein
MFRTIDTFLIDRIFQPTSNAYQRFVGLTNFSLARTCYLLDIALCSIAFAILGALGFPVAISVIALFALTLETMMSITVVNVVERKISQLGDTRTMNPMRICPMQAERRRYGLILCLIMLTLLTALSISMPISNHIGAFVAYCTIVLMTIAVIAHTAGDYFLVCTPLPPAQSLLAKMSNALKDWAKNLSASGNPVPQPA